MTEPGPPVVDAREVHDRVMRATTLLIEYVSAESTPAADDLTAAGVDPMTPEGQVAIAAAGILRRACAGMATLLTDAAGPKSGREVVAADVWRAVSTDEAAYQHRLAAMREALQRQREAG